MKHGGRTGAPGIAQRRPLPTGLEFPNPAMPAEALPDQIAAVTAAPLTDDEFAYGVATFLCAELTKRDAEIAELRAGLAELKKQLDEPDLDGRLNIKRAASIFHCSEETVRRRCAAGQIEASKDRGQWRIKIP